MHPLRLLGTGLLKKEKYSKTDKVKSVREKSMRSAKKAASVEIFLREILGTRLIQIDKKF